jgi:hypothetical protein
MNDTNDSKPWIATDQVTKLLNALYGDAEPQFYSFLRQEHAACYFSYRNETPLV